MKFSISNDAYGLPLSTPSRSAADHFIKACELILSVQTGAQAELESAIECDEDFALAYAQLAMVYSSHFDFAQAELAAARAVKLSPLLTRREQQHVEIVAAIIDGQPAKALNLIQKHLLDFPGDILLVNTGYLLLSLSGQPKLQEHAVEWLETLKPVYGDDWDYLSIYSFSLHEANRFKEARQAAERALNLYPRSGHAAHSLAHVYFETADLRGGREFLAEWLPDYSPQGIYYGHFYWHLALFNLSEGNYHKALEIFEQYLRPALPSGNQLPDTVSLLWRFVIYGFNGSYNDDAIKTRWAEAHQLAGRMAARPGRAFFDAHAGLAYAGAGDKANLETLRQDLQALAAGGHALAGKVVLPLVEGAAAFIEGDYNLAASYLKPAIETGEIARLGGSKAQREVFEDTLLEAYLRARRLEEAEVLLLKRLKNRTWGRDYFNLARLQRMNGKLQAASQNYNLGIKCWRGADFDAPELTNYNL